MKSLLMMLLVAGIAFGASAAGSMYLKQKKDAAAAKDGEAEEGSGGHGTAAAGPSTTVAAAHGAEPAAAHGGAHGDTAHAPKSEPKVAEPQPKPGSSEAGLPTAIRPRPVSVEELLRYSLGLKTREEGLARREKEIDRRQSQVAIVLGDIQGEQQELDGLRAQVKEQLASVESMLSQLAAERQDFEAKRTEAADELKKLDSNKQEASDSEQANVKKMSVWFQGMEPEKAATVIKELANDGKLDLAVQMLSNFEERDASKVLSAIDDTTLTVQLAEAFRKYKKPVKKTASNR